MQNKTAKLYIALFVLLLVAPPLLWAVLKGPLRAVLPDTADYENTALVQRPELHRQTIRSFPADATNYYNANLPFRDQLLTLGGLADYYVLHSTNTTSVLVGRDGWLFYRGNQANGEDPVADYKGTNLFSDRELAQIWMQMKSAQNLCESMDRPFVVMVVPGKMRIYADEMPASYGEPGDGRLRQVTSLLRDRGISVVNPAETI